MNYITVGVNKVFLDQTVRQSPNNRPYRLSTIKKQSTSPSKWIKKNGVNVECWCWYYVLIYTDTDEFFGFLFDYNDEFIKKLTHNEIMTNVLI